MRGPASPEEKRISYKRERMIMLLVGPLLVVLLVFLKMDSIKLFIATDGERQAYQELLTEKKQLIQGFQQGMVDASTYRESYDRIEQYERDLLDNISLWPWGHHDAVRYVELMFMCLVMSMCCLYMPYSMVKRHESVFMQKPVKEDMLKFSAEPKSMLFLDTHGLELDWVVNEFFKSREDWDNLWRVFNDILIADEVIWQPTGEDWQTVRQRALKQRMVVLDLPNINLEIKKYVDEMIALARINGTVASTETENRMRFILTFVLFHFVTIFFGNVSTALISRFIKDYALKRCLAVYISGCTIITGDVHRPDEKEASEILYILQNYRKLYKEVLVELENKFSYIPPDYVVYRTLQRYEF